MAVVVIDTNVLVAAAGDANTSLNCEFAAYQFVLRLAQSTDWVAVDHNDAILGEYRNNLNQRANPQSIGFELYKQLHAEGRFDYQIIEFDPAGHAVLPQNCQISDLNDRKFVAVALAHPDHPNIYNATDSDWQKDTQKLTACGVCVIELCNAKP